ncbi:MAG TPA: TonB-dependent receptor [Tepidisphaeraceae bacterium]|jgi:vitamin B12 transporter|nr:TonB-dependent receptor [Tepidisphaeraceae bacterium]
MRMFLGSQFSRRAVRILTAIVIAFVLARGSRAQEATTRPVTQPSAAPSANPVADTQPSVAPISNPAQAVRKTARNPVAAESGTTSLGEVVVTANRVPTTAADLGSSVTVITGEEIAQKQQPLVSDVLRGTPGLDVVRSGGPNQITSVFMRGANSDHTLVLIDGIEANDPSSPSRAFDFSTLTVDDIDRIEVLRGPQSTLWGSNAIGGVINVITKRGQGPLSGYVSAEGGSFNTFRESVGFSGSEKIANYSLNITQANSQGFPAADAKYGNQTPDGYDTLSMAGRFGLTLSSQFDIDVIARVQHNRVRIDDGGGPGQDDPRRWLKSDQDFIRVQPHLVLFDGALVQTYGFNYTHYTRSDTDPAAPTQDDGDVLKFDFQNDLHLCKADTLTAGVDFYQEGFSATQTPQKYANSLGLFIQDQFDLNDRLFFTGGMRYEDHSLTGSNVTYRFTGAYLFPTDTKIHASYGTGFKSPTLSDLYSSYGSRDLKAEKSMGWDAGVEQSFFKRAVVLDATYFDNHFTNLIDYDFIANREANIGEARAQGVEIGAAVRPCDKVTTGINYTYTNTQDETTRLSLLRRAPSKIGSFLNYRYSRQGSVTLTANYVSHRADIDPVTFNRTNIGGYVLMNLATSYKINDSLEFTARIDNFLNAHYEEVAGFGTADISFYAGLKLSF